MFRSMQAIEPSPFAFIIHHYHNENDGGNDALTIMHASASPRNGTIQNQKEPPPKGTTAKIRIVMKSPGKPLLGNNLGRCTRKIGLPEQRVLYTVLRSPHIDKKSREQSEMEIHKQLLVTETETHELRKKLFWSKRRATRRT